MAKKKTINLTNGNRDAVVSGDVNISYKNVRIAGLSESTTAVLETKDTICEDDIEIEYTKPEAQGVNVPLYIKPVGENAVLKGAVTGTDTCTVTLTEDEMLNTIGFYVGNNGVPYDNPDEVYYPIPYTTDDTLEYPNIVVPAFDPSFLGASCNCFVITTSSFEPH